MKTPFKKQYWGYHTLIKLQGCNHDLITSEQKIHEYVIQLCDLIGMKRFKEPFIYNFGETEEVAGYSLVQLIYTSNITGHFVNSTDEAYIDIFSCKPYKYRIASMFTKEFFGAKLVSSRYIKR